MYSEPIQNLIKELKKLPSVGERTAERYVFYWLKTGKGEVNALKNSLDELLNKIKSCKQCWNFSESDICEICANTKRDPSVICVVLDPPDIPVIEKTGEFNGRYHCVREHLDPTDPTSLAKTKIPELLERIEKDKNIKEILIALNPSLEGETTAMYLENKIKKEKLAIKVSRLARGLPMGADLQYADEITLGNAIKHRF